MEKFNMLIEYLMHTEGYQGHSSSGERISICISMESVKTISQLSYLVGKMEMCKVHGDDENFLSLVIIFDNKCIEQGVDLVGFEQWVEDNKDNDE